MSLCPGGLLHHTLLYRHNLDRACAAPDSTQLEVDGTIGATVDTSAMTNNAQRLAALRRAYPDLEIQSLVEGVHDTLGNVWFLDYRSDHVRNVVTASTVTCP